MRLAMVLTEDADRDLHDLYEYIATHDSPAAAEHLLKRVLEVSESLSSNPVRGSPPKELQALGDKEYRQVFFKPYRLIYRVYGGRVVVFVIADGRRDMQSLLARRLLDG
jgi:toxin ParE1/3/4